MSVEAYVLSAIVEEGTPRAAFQAQVNGEDFIQYDEEWGWIVDQAEKRRPINRRRFKQAFPDFEFVLVDERIQDLLEELKQERSFEMISSALDSVARELTPNNTLEQAEILRDVVASVLRFSHAASDVMLTSDWKNHLKEIRNLRTLYQQGYTLGIPTGLKNLDHHWGGLMPGRMIVVIGRPGQSKSMLQAKLFTEAFWAGHRVALFSPEMNEHEHRCRIGTLLSAKKEIQEELGLKGAFRNRALMVGHGFDAKAYKRFWQYLETRRGEMILFTQKWRRTKMTPSYIESKVDDLGIEAAFIDPIYKLKPQNRRQIKHEEIADLVDAIQDISEAFNIPVVISNQAHRQMSGKDDAPHQDTSFGSDAPAQEGDHVVGVKHVEDENLLMLRCTKNRFGGNFRVECKFHPNVGIVEDMTPLRGNYMNGNGDDLPDEDE
jgi:hypothetical protein